MAATATPATSYETAYPVTPIIPRSQDENIPIAKPPPPAVNRISKSRTFNVLSNLTANITQSLSRSSFGSRNASGSSSHTIFADPTEVGPQATRSALPRPARKSADNGLTSLANNSVLLISEAQPAAYWSGRFVALNDRFLNELLMPRSLETVLGAHSALVHGPRSNLGASSPSKQAYLRPSNTSGAVMQSVSKPPVTADVTFLLDEDNRHRRVFVHLKAMCVNNDAKKSLHAFQQDYARRMKKECLLPKGGTMEDRGLVSRIFGARRISGAVPGSVKGAKLGVDGRPVKASKRLSFM